MIHTPRTYSAIQVRDIEELAQRLAQSWTLCTAFLVEHDGQPFLIANDATSEDGAQEYAVLRVDERHGRAISARQVDSLTISWMSEDRIRAGWPEWFAEQPSSRGIVLQVESPARHGRCRFCAWVGTSGRMGATSHPPPDARGTGLDI